MQDRTIEALLEIAKALNSIADAIDDLGFSKRSKGFGPGAIEGLTMQIRDSMEGLAQSIDALDIQSGGA